MALDYILLSKTISHALRHQPWLYELELNEEGWTSVVALLDALRTQRKEWCDLNEDDLLAMIANSDKCRIEIEAGRVRAISSRPVCGVLRETPGVPPEVLYHGTYAQAVKKILAGGLRPMRREYVHLSTDVQTAMEVGKRKSPKPVVLRVNAARAASEGICFYKGNDRVWLADSVPAKYIEAAEG